MLKRYSTLTERINAEFFVDRSGKSVKYQPHYEYDEAGTVTWLDKEDKPYALVSLHSEIAQQVLGGRFNGACKELENEGWTVVGRCGYNFPYCMRKPTQKQIDAMFDLGYTKCCEELWKDGEDKWITVWEFHK